MSLVALFFLAGVMMGAADPRQAAGDSYHVPSRNNGYRIFLSPASHSDSGARGECGPVGENQMAMGVAYNAATGDYYDDYYNTTSSLRNLRVRGY